MFSFFHNRRPRRRNSLFHGDHSLLSLHSSEIPDKIPVPQSAPDAELSLVVLWSHQRVNHLQCMVDSCHLQLAQTYPGETTARRQGWRRKEIKWNGPMEAFRVWFYSGQAYACTCMYKKTDIQDTWNWWQKLECWKNKLLTQTLTYLVTTWSFHWYQTAGFSPEREHQWGTAMTSYIKVTCILILVMVVSLIT